jgi:UDP-N-acetylglucosamine 2-epimerase (non-hydrolysing)
VSERLRILVVAGTRPEAIKVAPVLRELRAQGRHEALLGVSAQHRSLLDQALEVFDLPADFDLDLMRPGQDLTDVSVRVLAGMREPLAELRPDLVLVQGDTTTVLMTALAAFYAGIAVGHIEAGLRTHDLKNPFPEEVNRRLVAPMAALHFAPSTRARDALLGEGIPAEQVHVTGNTSIDALFHIREQKPAPALAAFGLERLDFERRVVAVTVHRRESFGEPIRNAFRAIRDLAAEFDDVQFVFPTHPNPNVLEPARELLSGHGNVFLCDPLPYRAFVELLERATFALSDSGGVQEEAPALGTPVLVLRETTERPEAAEAGGAVLTGTDPQRIHAEARRLLTSEDELARMSTPRFPYGRGDAGKQIAAAIDAAAGSLLKG